MQTVELGNSREHIPAIGIGTWKLGADRKGTIDVIRYAISHGAAYVDTAEMYSNEEIVGEAIKGERLFLATKVSPNHFKEKDVIRACDESLRKLGVKTIDLYQLHWPNSSVPIKETMRAMEKLVDEGKIRHIGVSNFNPQELNAAQEAMRTYDIVSNQIEYSVLVRDFGDALSEYCMENKILIIAYSPLGSGAIYDERFGSAHVLLEDIGSRYKKTASQVALNWLIEKGNVAVIPKASRIDHFEEDLGAVGWRLSQADMKAIDEIGQLKAPLAGKLGNPVIKRTAGLWSGLMTKMEKRRVEKGAQDDGKGK